MSEPMLDLVVARDPVHANEWRVEHFDDDGGCYVTIFSGPEAEQRARGYHAILQWSPAAEDGALPDPLRRYIHELEMARDPAGDLRELFRLREENAALRRECERLARGAVTVNRT